MKRPPCVLAMAIASCIAVPALAITPAESDAPQTLDTIAVRAMRDKQRSANQNVVQMDAAQLQQEQAESMEDIVRYVPGVSIADMGRFGENGFNIRGIEGDRVAMTIDGLSMAEGLETARSYEFFRAGRGGVDVDSLKRVEIIKGADSISAGSGALGGAVVFTTKDPYDYLKPQGNDTHLGFKAGYTGYNDQALGSVSLANRTGLVESMLIYTRRQGHQADGWYDTTAVRTGSARRTPDPIDHDSTNVLSKIDVVLGDAHRLGVVYERNRVENLVENLSRVSAPGYIERWGDDHNDRDRYGLRYLWTAHGAAFDTLELQADRQDTESRGTTRIVTGSGMSSTPATANSSRCTLAATCWRAEDRDTEQTLDRVALDLDKQLQSGIAQHRLAYGAAWQRRQVDFSAIDYRWNNVGALDTATVDPSQVPSTDADNWNLFLRDRIGLDQDRLQLTLGARYDHYRYSPRLDASFVDPTGTVRQVSFSAPTWQAGISYAFLPEHTVWFQAGRGFRAPTTGEMYAPTSTAELTVVGTGQTVSVPTLAANPDLDAEKSLNLELGWRWETPKVLLGVSVFRDRYDDFIDTLATTVDAGTQYRSCSRGACTVRNGYSVTSTVNVGQAIIKGVELEGLWRLDERWLLRGAWTHNHGELDDGTPLNAINPDRGVLGLSWQGLDDRVRITGNLSHSLAKKRSDVAVADDVFGSTPEPFLSDAYTVFDLFGSYRINARVRLNAGVYNLFDTRYSQWARIRNVTRGDFYLYGYATDEGIGRYSEPGRNLRMTVYVTF
ncbi:TonB-dependent hemoglobin/transferrin/lactoferrin family receptor [Pseudoxanthomonas composti]|uniref:TonB-dependent hemoglobin/transferrin/lactoferrin family receptor n=1 Tax=Pseudoxanthomonas composti TaxID=2137479 RepID=A0A4Q1JUY6_9GAMM|nr:TonB-dependent hemoglobin/transferrin/lactoferrin family receptor [Pseudoxanthomonas composti]RXR05941.1 TonB-dependent hemoglobin/transferrin/lactoferrin family receptor [Pseudoxanthomonas composti]